MNYIQQGCGKIIKVAPFRHKRRHIKTTNLRQKDFVSS